MDIADRSGCLEVLLYARDNNKAEAYCKVLEDYDIPATIGDQSGFDVEGSFADIAIEGDVPVLVPESLYDESKEIIAETEDALGFEFDDEGELLITSGDNRDMEFMHEDDGSGDLGGVEESVEIDEQWDEDMA